MQLVLNTSIIYFFLFHAITFTHASSLSHFLVSISLRFNEAVVFVLGCGRGRAGSGPPSDLQERRSLTFFHNLDVRPYKNNCYIRPKKRNGLLGRVKNNW